MLLVFTSTPPSVTSSRMPTPALQSPHSHSPLCNYATDGSTLTFASSNRPKALKRFPRSLRTQYSSCTEQKTAKKKKHMSSNCKFTSTATNDTAMCPDHAAYCHRLHHLHCTKLRVHCNLWRHAAETGFVHCQYKLSRTCIPQEG